jgi:hypothetical protein
MIVQRSGNGKGTVYKFALCEIHETRIVMGYKDQKGKDEDGVMRTDTRGHGMHRDDQPLR